MMKKNIEKRPATTDEFYQTVDQEFSFLISKFGYSQEVKNSPFCIEYHKDVYCLRLSSTSYGFALSLEFLINNELLPLWPVVNNLGQRKTRATDKPQLDEVREYAWRLLYECPALLEGDPVFIASIRDTLRDEEKRHSEQQAQFFEVAEILFEAGHFQDLVKYLTKSPYQLPSVWAERLAFAQKHLAQ